MSEKLNKILVPIDFSEQSLIALGQSYNLARETNSEITLLYVIEDGGIISRFFSKEQHEEMKKEVQAQLDKLAEEVRSTKGLVVSTLIARGAPYDKIAEVAELLNAEFIVMGCNGHDSIKKKFMGSNSLKVVRESRVPVISIKGKHHRDGCKNIVLPLDLTKETKEKVNRAIWLAKLGTGAAIRVVSVLFTTDEFVVNRLTRQLGQVKTFIDKAGVECSAEILKGIKGEETLAQNVIDYAHKVDGDLIMIMTQQEVDFTPYFLGSAAQEIIVNSDVPVLSITPMIKKDMTVFKPY
jgi:nucleotide-binding universal stress UspA family protein